MIDRAANLTPLFVNPHMFIEPFTPPVPLVLCLAASAAAVVASFVLLGFFARNPGGFNGHIRMNISDWKVIGILSQPTARLLIEVPSVFIFVLIISAGFFGNEDPLYNIAPTFVWVIWWVGIAYISAFLGNIWSVINPWKIIFNWGENIWKIWRRGGTVSPMLRYPANCGAWPAVFCFLVFAWVENVYDDAVVPFRISQLILTYSLITWSGMLLFGKECWLARGETFSLVFGFLAKFAPIQRRFVQEGVASELGHGGVLCSSTGKCGSLQPVAHSINRHEIYVSPFASRLIEEESISFSQSVFVLVLLATVTFDGFTGTEIWKNVQSYVAVSMPNVMLINTVGLGLAVLSFIAIYFVFITLMRLVSRSNLGILVLARLFVCTLIPIVLAYHVAHFLLFLLIQGQMIVPLASDPFGFGWDLWHTANYRVNLTVLGSQVFWGISVVSIVAGHIIAVFLAHNVALRFLRPARYAIRSQYPMIVLMVGYTVASLWIITQPMYP